MGFRKHLQEITEKDIEEMERLAEDVVHQLDSNYADYDDEGNTLFEKYYNLAPEGEEWSSSKAHEQYLKEYEALYARSEAHLLHELFRRGDDIGDVRYYTTEEIRPWIEPVIPKALALFRKGTMDVGDTNYVAASSVPDAYLIAAFAREVRNMMMIFAGQKMHEENVKRYLLLITAEDWNHDADEWVGIYFDNADLKEAYDSLVEEFNERHANGEYHELQKPAIYEFSPRMKGFSETDGRGRLYSVEQNCRQVEPEELRCFKGGKRL